MVFLKLLVYFLINSLVWSEMWQVIFLVLLCECYGLNKTYVHLRFTNSSDCFDESQHMMDYMLEINVCQEYTPTFSGNFLMFNMTSGKVHFVTFTSPGCDPRYSFHQQTFVMDTCSLYNLTSNVPVGMISDDLHIYASLISHGNPYEEIREKSMNWTSVSYYTDGVCRDTIDYLEQPTTMIFKKDVFIYQSWYTKLYCSETELLTVFSNTDNDSFIWGYEYYPSFLDDDCSDRTSQSLLRSHDAHKSFRKKCMSDSKFFETTPFEIPTTANYLIRELYYTEDCLGDTFAFSQYPLHQCDGLGNIVYNNGSSVLSLHYRDDNCEEGSLVFIQQGKMEKSGRCSPFAYVLPNDRGWGFKAYEVDEQDTSTNLGFVVIDHCENYLNDEERVNEVKKKRNREIIFIQSDTCIRNQLWGGTVNIPNTVGFTGRCDENGVVTANNFTLVGCENLRLPIVGDFCFNSGFYDLYATCIPFFCFDKEMWDVNVCGGHGNCIGTDSCECQAPFTGRSCQNTVSSKKDDDGTLATVIIFSVIGIVGVSGGSILAILIIVTIFLLLCCCLSCVLCGVILLSLIGGLNFVLYKIRMNRLENLADLDLDHTDIQMIREEKQKPEHFDHLKINKDLFIVEYDKIRIIKKIGEGGSDSIVFKASYQGRAVAFKCFRTTNLMNQVKYDEFEREVEILSSLHHPNVLQFMGATLKTPRVGILMEYCEFGDLTNYMTTRKEISDNSVPIKEKVRYLKEISSAVRYLHGSNVIHRDLKPENILVSQNFEMKVMDFGLSRHVKASDSMLTKRVGTSFYMAPEVSRGEDYTEKCDVFSYAIIVFNVICEDFKPYGEFVAQNLEFKVANDPMYRPSAVKKDWEGHFEGGLGWLSELMFKCWDAEDSNRPSFEEIDRTIQKFGGLDVDEDLYEEIMGQKNNEKVEEKEERKKKNMMSSSGIRSRLNELEEENKRLKDRIKQMETEKE